MRPTRSSIAIGQHLFDAAPAESAGAFRLVAPVARGASVRLPSVAGSMSTLGFRRQRIGVTVVVLAAALLAAPRIAARTSADVTLDVVVKAALLFNFAKFAEWPALPSAAPIVVCIVADDGIAGALVTTVRGQQIGGHAIEVRRSQESGTWRACQLLFIGEAGSRLSAAGLGGIKTLPVLTVSDGKGFSQGGGIIELYVEGGRMRFAINVDAAERSGLHLSSRLLGLARVIRDGQIQ